MSNILAISSATKKAYICLKKGEKRDYSEIDANCKQSENMLFEIDKLLSKHNIGLEDIDEIVVVIGPGSFTGIRIGIALVKGFCAGNKKLKVYPISTLDLMAKHVKVKEKFVTVLNALSGLCFVKNFDGKGRIAAEEKMITTDELQALDCKKIGLDEESVCEEKISLSAEVLLEFAEEKIASGNNVKSSELNAIYLRNSQAEENLNKNKKIN